MENIICHNPNKILVKLKNGSESYLYKQLIDYTNDEILAYKLYLLSTSPDFYSIYGNYEKLQKDPNGLSNASLYGIDIKNINNITLEPSLHTIINYYKSIQDANIGLYSIKKSEIEFNKLDGVISDNISDLDNYITQKEDESTFYSDIENVIVNASKGIIYQYNINDNPYNKKQYYLILNLIGNININLVKFLESENIANVLLKDNYNIKERIFLYKAFEDFYTNNSEKYSIYEILALFNNYIKTITPVDQNKLFSYINYINSDYDNYKLFLKNEQPNINHYHGHIAYINKNGDKKNITVILDDNINNIELNDFVKQAIEKYSSDNNFLLIDRNDKFFFYNENIPELATDIISKIQNIEFINIDNPSYMDAIFNKINSDIYTFYQLIENYKSTNNVNIEILTQLTLRLLSSINNYKKLITNNKDIIYDIFSAINNFNLQEIVSKIDISNITNALNISVKPTLNNNIIIKAINNNNYILLKNKEITESTELVFKEEFIEESEVDFDTIIKEQLNLSVLENTNASLLLQKLYSENKLEKDILFSKRDNNLFYLFNKLKSTDSKIILNTDIINKLLNDLLESDNIAIREIMSLIKDNIILNSIILEKGPIKGTYNSNGTMYLRNSIQTEADFNTVFMHELIHSATLNKIEKIRKDIKNASPEDVKNYKELVKLFEYAKKIAAKQNLNFYGLTNEQEFISELFTNKEFFKWANSIIYKKQSFIKTIIDSLLKLFNIKIGSIAHKGFELSFKLLNNKQDVYDFSITADSKSNIDISEIDNNKNLAQALVNNATSILAIYDSNKEPEYLEVYKIAREKNIPIILMSSNNLTASSERITRLESFLSNNNTDKLLIIGENIKNSRFSQENIDTFAKTLITYLDNNEENRLLEKVKEIVTTGESGFSESFIKILASIYSNKKEYPSIRIISKENYQFTQKNGEISYGKDEFLKRFSLDTMDDKIETKRNIAGYLIEIMPDNVTRISAESDTNSFYIFTDNLDRTSLGTNVDENGWYYKKYGKLAKERHKNKIGYPTKTLAILRGLENAFPITTVKEFKYIRDISIEDSQWGSLTDIEKDNKDFELFKKTIDEEISYIKEQLSKNPNKVLKVPKFKIGQPSAANPNTKSNLSKRFYDYLTFKLLELGIDNSKDFIEIVYKKEELIGDNENKNNIIKAFLVNRTPIRESFWETYLYHNSAILYTNDNILNINELNLFLYAEQFEDIKTHYLNILKEIEDTTDAIRGKAVLSEDRKYLELPFIFKKSKNIFTVKISLLTDELFDEFNDKKIPLRYFIKNNIRIFTKDTNDAILEFLQKKEKLSPLLYNDSQEEYKEKYEENTIDLSSSTLYSGDAKGADKKFAEKAKKLSIGKIVNYQPSDLKKLNELQRQEVENAYLTAVKDLKRKVLQYNWENPQNQDYPGGLVRRDYLQAKAADAIFAISDIILPNEKGKPNKENIRYINKTSFPIVDGGTGYAVQMAINLKKPVYVFHQGTNSDNNTEIGWYKWNYEEKRFEKISIPKLTKKFAGIGTREINKLGIKAIDELFENSISTIKEKSKKIIKKQTIQEGLDIYRNALTQEEQVEFYKFGKSILEKHGYNPFPQYVMASAGKMEWSPELVVDKNGKEYNRGNNYNIKIISYKKHLTGTEGNAERWTYHYYLSNMDGSKITPIPQNIINILEKITGQDMSDYDTVLINLYPKGRTLGWHTDVTEDYRNMDRDIVSVSIGAKADFLYANTPDTFIVGDPEKASIPLEPTVIVNSGDIIVFGGKSRLISHTVTGVRGKTKLGNIDLSNSNVNKGFKGGLLLKDDWRINFTFRVADFENNKGKRAAITEKETIIIPIKEDNTQLSLFDNAIITQEPNTLELNQPNTIKEETIVKINKQEKKLQLSSKENPLIIYVDGSDVGSEENRHVGFGIYTKYNGKEYSYSFATKANLLDTNNDFNIKLISKGKNNNTLESIGTLTVIRLVPDNEYIEIRQDYLGLFAAIIAKIIAKEGNYKGGQNKYADWFRKLPKEKQKELFKKVLSIVNIDKSVIENLQTPNWENGIKYDEHIASEKSSKPSKDFYLFEYTRGQYPKDDILDTISDQIVDILYNNKKGKITLSWVEGHSGESGNEKVDKIAKDQKNYDNLTSLFLSTEEIIPKESKKEEKVVLPTLKEDFEKYKKEIINSLPEYFFNNLSLANDGTVIQIGDKNFIKLSETGLWHYTIDDSEYVISDTALVKVIMKKYFKKEQILPLNLEDTIYYIKNFTNDSLLKVTDELINNIIKIIKINDIPEEIKEEPEKNISYVNIAGAEKYITNFDKKKDFFEKDKIKFEKATKLISRGYTNSSSFAYEKAALENGNVVNGVLILNNGRKLIEYHEDDVVGISVNGNSPNRIEVDYSEIAKAISKGVKTFITDNKEDRYRDYNIGERNVAKYLYINGYRELNNSGIWEKKYNINQETLIINKNEKYTSEEKNEDISIKDDFKIEGKKDGVFSNYHQLDNPIIDEYGNKYYNSEGYYMALRTNNLNIKKEIASKSEKGGQQSRNARISYKNELDQNEDNRIKYMQQAVRAKFMANPKLINYLLDTKEKRIVEYNTWGDNLFGVPTTTLNNRPDVIPYQGNNGLGKILMELREEILTQTEPYNVRFEKIREKVYGFVTDDNRVYIDTSEMRLNNMIHEYYHIYDDILLSNYEYDEKAASLIDRANSFVLQLGIISDLKSENAYKNLSEDKLYAEARARLVATLVSKEISNINISLLNKLKQWISDFVDYLKSLFSITINNLSPEDILKMSLEDFGKLLTRELVIERSFEKIKEKQNNIEKLNNILSYDKRTALQNIILGNEQTWDTSPFGTARNFFARVFISGTKIRANKEKYYEQQSNYEEKHRIVERYLQYNPELKISEEKLAEIKMLPILSDTGDESIVYISEDRKKVYKITEISPFNLVDNLNRYIVHNMFFENTKYTVIGIYVDLNVINIVTEQPFIQSTQEYDVNALDTFLQYNNFKQDIDYSFLHYTNNQLSVSFFDIGKNNVIFNNDAIFFIDPLISIDLNLFADTYGILPELKNTDYYLEDQEIFQIFFEQLFSNFKPYIKEITTDENRANEILREYEQENIRFSIDEITPKVNIVNFRNVTAEDKKLANAGNIDKLNKWAIEEISEFYEAVDLYNKNQADELDVGEEALGLIRMTQIFLNGIDLLYPYHEDIFNAIDSIDFDKAYDYFKAKKTSKGQALNMTKESLLTTLHFLKELYKNNYFTINVNGNNYVVSKTKDKIQIFRKDYDYFIKERDIVLEKITENTYEISIGYNNNYILNDIISILNEYIDDNSSISLRPNFNYTELKFIDKLLKNSNFYIIKGNYTLKTSFTPFINELLSSIGPKNIIELQLINNNFIFNKFLVKKGDKKDVIKIKKPNNVIAGFVTPGQEIYINSDIKSANTLFHEFYHIYDNVILSLYNTDERAKAVIDKINDLLDENSYYLESVKADNVFIESVKNKNDEETRKLLYAEARARLIGDAAQSKIKEAEFSWLSRFKQALKDLVDYILDLIGTKSFKDYNPQQILNMTMEEFTNVMTYDMMYDKSFKDDLELEKIGYDFLKTIDGLNIDEPLIKNIIDAIGTNTLYEIIKYNGIEIFDIVNEKPFLELKKELKTAYQYQLKNKDFDKNIDTLVNISFWRMFTPYFYNWFGDWFIKYKIENNIDLNENEKSIFYNTYNNNYDNLNDNVSKVLTEQGVPKLVYHGSDYNFYEFKKLKHEYQLHHFGTFNSAFERVYRLSSEDLTSEDKINSIVDKHDKYVNQYMVDSYDALAKVTIKPYFLSIKKLFKSTDKGVNRYKDHLPEDVDGYQYKNTAEDIGSVSYATHKPDKIKSAIVASNDIYDILYNYLYKRKGLKLEESKKIMFSKFINLETNKNIYFQSLDLNDNQNNEISDDREKQIEELFDNNPKIANQVYEALGFISDNISVEWKSQDEYDNYVITKNNKYIGEIQVDSDGQIWQIVIESDFQRQGYATQAYLKLLNLNPNVYQKQSNSNEKSWKAYQKALQQEQQAIQLYSQYLESLNKPNTNPILQDNQQEQVKKFAELQERLSNKEFLEGAKNAYESTPALQQYGTQEEYNDYIARVSLGILKNPSSGEYNYTSQVKDIVYHGTTRLFDQFDLTKRGEYSWRNKGIHFTNSKDVYSQYQEGESYRISFLQRFYDVLGIKYDNSNITQELYKQFYTLYNDVITDLAKNKENSKYYKKETDGEDNIIIGKKSIASWDWVKNLFNGDFPNMEYLVQNQKTGLLEDTRFKKEGYLKIALINTKNPYVNTFSDITQNDFYAEQGEKSHKEDRTDSSILNSGDVSNYVVFEPEQIHILGSKQDIQGFKEFNQSYDEKNARKEIELIAKALNKGFLNIETFILDSKEFYSKLNDEKLKNNVDIKYNAELVFDTENKIIETLKNGDRELIEKLKIPGQMFLFLLRNIYDIPNIVELLKNITIYDTIYSDYFNEMLPENVTFNSYVGLEEYNKPLPKGIVFNEDVELRKYNYPLPKDITFNGTVYLASYNQPLSEGIVFNKDVTLPKYTKPLPEGIVFNEDVTLANYDQPLPKDITFNGNVNLASYNHPLPKGIVFNKNVNLASYNHPLPEGIIFNGNVDLSNYNQPLPEDITFNGTLIKLTNYNKPLPKGIVFNGNVDLSNHNQPLPKDITFKGTAYLAGYNKPLPEGIVFNGNVDLSNYNQPLPEGVVFNGNVKLTNYNQPLPKGTIFNREVELDNYNAPMSEGIVFNNRTDLTKFNHSLPKNTIFNGYTILQSYNQPLPEGIVFNGNVHLDSYNHPLPEDIKFNNIVSLLSYNHPIPENFKGFSNATHVFLYALAVPFIRIDMIVGPNTIVKYDPNIVINIDATVIPKSVMSSISNLPLKDTYPIEYGLSYTKVPGYIAGAPGKYWRIDINVEQLAKELFIPKEFFYSFNFHNSYGTYPIGWVGGTIDNNILYITEIQSDLLQSLFVLTERWQELNFLRNIKEKFGYNIRKYDNKMLDVINNIAKNENKSIREVAIERKYITEEDFPIDFQWLGRFSNTKVNKEWKAFKSKLENATAKSHRYYQYIALSYFVLKNSHSIKKIRIPTSDRYKEHHPSVPETIRSIYDDLGNVYDNIIIHNNKNLPDWYEIDVEDISNNTNENSQTFYIKDIIIKSFIIEFVEENKKINKDLQSDLNNALDAMVFLKDKQKDIISISNNNNGEIKLIKEYIDTESGKNHLEQIEEWIYYYFSDDTPLQLFNADNDTGGSELVDTEGNVIESNEDDQYAKNIDIDINKSYNKNALIDFLLEELDIELNQKPQNQAKINAIKQRLSELNNSDSRFFYDNHGIIYGYAIDNKIYLNKDTINLNLLFEEAGHIWINWAQYNRQDLYLEGINKVKGSIYEKEVRNNKYYIAQALLQGEEGSFKYEQYILEEALAKAIADNGDSFIEEYKSKFKEWVNRFFEAIAKLLGLNNMTIEEIRLLSLKDFSINILHDLFSETEINQQYKFKNESNIEKSKELDSNISSDNVLFQISSFEEEEQYIDDESIQKTNELFENEEFVKEISEIVYPTEEYKETSKILNNGTYLNLSEEEIDNIYNNYIALMDRKREGKGINREKFQQVFDNLQVFVSKNTYIFGEWDSKNNVFKARLMSSPSIRELYTEIDELLNTVNFMAFVPDDIGKMLEKKKLYRLQVDKPYNFRGEDMLKNLYFSNKELAEKVFKKPIDSISFEDVSSYDKFFNYWSLIYKLKNVYLEKDYDKIFPIITQLGIYDYNAYKIMNKIKLQKLTQEEIENIVNIIIANSQSNKVQIDKTDIINNPEIYNELDNELNKTLAMYLSKFGIKTELLDSLQLRLNIDSLSYLDILNKIIYVNKNNQENYPQEAGKIIAFMMQKNPLVSEIINELDKKAMFKNLTLDEKLESIGDLIAKELHKKTNTSIPISLLEKIKLLIQQFFNFINSIKIARINRNIGIIADNILIQNQSLITQNIFKPDSINLPTEKVDFETALNRDSFAREIVDKLSPYFILTGSITLSLQGSIYRPVENLIHDLDWVSALTREETNKIVKNIYPNAVYVREILQNNEFTDSWLIPQEGYTITDLEQIGEKKKIVSYNIRDKENNIVSTYTNKGKEEFSNPNINVKQIDLFSKMDNSSIKPFSKKKIGNAIIYYSNWQSTFSAKLFANRLKDIWDYNRFIPNDYIFDKATELKRLYSLYLSQEDNQPTIDNFKQWLQYKNNKYNRQKGNNIQLTTTINKPTYYTLDTESIKSELPIDAIEVQETEIDINKPLISLINHVLSELNNEGYNPLIIGGAVRDALLGKKPKDIDIEVYGITREKLESVLQKYGKVDAVGRAFGIFKFSPWDSTINYLNEEELPNTGIILPMGISGSGKSTWAKNLLSKKENIVIISPDQIRKELTGNISDQTRNTEVYQIAKERAIEEYNKGNLVILDATNVSTKGRNDFVGYFKNNSNADIYLKILESNPEISKQRVKEDIEKGFDRSQTPEEIIDLQYKQYLESIDNISNALSLEEPFDFSVPRKENKIGVGYTAFVVDFDENMTIKEASERRDFTWNSIGYNPITKMLYDYFGGISDLANGIIRHTSEKFAEDPLRILRAMQFQARMGHIVAPETYSLMQDIVLTGAFDHLVNEEEYKKWEKRKLQLLELEKTKQLTPELQEEYNNTVYKIPRERIVKEWEKWATKGKYHSKIFDFLRKTGLGYKLYPELMELKNTPQDVIFHPEGDVEEHTKQVVTKAMEIAKNNNLNSEEQQILILSALLHDIAKPETTKEEYSEKLGRMKITAKGHEPAGEPKAINILNRMGYHKDIQIVIGRLIGEHLAHATIASLTPELELSKPKKSAFAKLIKRLKPANIEQLLLLMEADMLGRNNANAETPISIIEFNNLLEDYKSKNEGKLEFKSILTGKHLIQAGLKPGKEFKDILTLAEEAQLNLEINNEPEALEWLYNYLSNKNNPTQENIEFAIKNTNNIEIVEKEETYNYILETLLKNFAPFIKEFTTDRYRAKQLLNKYEKNKKVESIIEEEDNNEILNTIDELISTGEIKMVDDETGEICASKGMKTSKINTGYKWEIIKDLKSYPTHEQGGVDIIINKEGINVNNTFKAQNGIVLPTEELETVYNINYNPFRLYPILEKYKDKINVVPDYGMTAKNTGAGTIEVMYPNQDFVNYQSGYKLHNPDMTKYSTIFHPLYNNAQSIGLDIISHVLHEVDPTFKKLKDNFIQNFLNIDNNHAEVEHWWKKYNAETQGNNDGKEQFYNNYIDGILRNLLFKGTPEEFEKARYWTEAKNEYLKYENINKAFSLIENYLYNTQ